MSCIAACRVASYPCVGVPATRRLRRGGSGKPYGLILIIVVPRSWVVAEMKPHARAEVHGYAGTAVMSPIAYVVVINVTTVVWPITYAILLHAASPVRSRPELGRLLRQRTLR